MVSSDDIKNDVDSVDDIKNDVIRIKNKSIMFNLSTDTG